MQQFIFKFSEKMATSSMYQKIKSFFRSLLDDVSYPYKKYFDAFMILLIMVSISVLILDKSGKIPQWLVELDLYFVTAIFAMEYLLRLWIHHDIHKMIVTTDKEKGIPYRVILKEKLHYIFSLPALIDFIAIFPEFRIIRLLKLYHYMHGASSLFNALLKKRFEFTFLGYMLFGITFTLGSIFYLLEFGINDNIHSYLDAIYWALVTISTVGYGDISPVTEVGKIVSMFGIIFGIAMISFVTSVMVSAFSERFDELRNQDSINYVNRMHNVVIINGYGHLGITIAKKLKQQKTYVPIIIEHDIDKAQLALQDGYKVIHADGSSASLIKMLCQRDNITAMLTLRSSDIDNIYFILNAKSMRVKAKVLTRINHNTLNAQYRATKVDGIIEPYAVVNEKAFRYLKIQSQESDKNITFLGYTHKSSSICKALQKAGIALTIFEVDETRYKTAQNDGFNSVVFIHQEHHKMPALSNTIAVCAMHEEAMNVYYAITLRANGFEEVIVSLSDSKEDNRKLLLAGVSKIFDMYEESANQFIEMIENKQSQNEGEKV